MSRKHRSLGRRGWTLVLVVVSMTVGFGLLPGAASAATCEDEFTGPGDWSESAKWSKSALPSSTEVACLTGAVTVTTTAVAGSVQAQSLEIAAAAGSLELASATGESTLTELRLAAGSVKAASGAKLALTGTLAWTGSEATTISGLAVSQTGASSLSISGTGAKTLTGKATISSEEPVAVGEGTLTIANESNLTAKELTLSGGTLLVEGTLTSPLTLTGGKLSGTGTVTGAVANTKGTVEPGGSAVGTLHFGSTFAQATEGTLAVQLKSTSEYDKLEVTGAVTRGGTLAISYVEPFHAARNAAFAVVKASSASGSFSISPPAGTFYEERLTGTEVEVFLALLPPEPEGAAPGVSGTPSLGSQLTCTHGGWNGIKEEGELKFAYTWFRDGGATSIAEAETYAVTSADIGHTLSCRVFATNKAGRSATGATSPGVLVPLPTEPAPKPPASTSAPTIAGILVVGQTIACQPGAWSSSPTSFAYQWYRDGTALPGATASTYTVVAVDQAHSLSCSITASNAAGVGAAAKSEARIVPRLTPLPLACSKLVVQLLSIRRSGGSLVVSGVALARYSGQKVTIKAVTVPSGVSAPGGAATVTADGTFVTRVHAPSGPGAARVRYAATLMGSKSPVLALAQPLQLVREGKTRMGVRLTLKGTGVLATGRHKVTVMRRETCAKSATLLKVKLGRGGVMTVTLPLPEAGALAFYEVATPVPGNRAYALAIAVPGVGG